MSRPSTTEYAPFFQTYINYTSGKDYDILVKQYHDRLVNSWDAIPMEKLNMLMDQINGLFSRCFST